MESIIPFLQPSSVLTPTLTPSQSEVFRVTSVDLWWGGRELSFRVLTIFKVHPNSNTAMKTMALNFRLFTATLPHSWRQVIGVRLPRILWASGNLETDGNGRFQEPVRALWSLLPSRFGLSLLSPVLRPLCFSALIVRGKGSHDISHSL